MACSPGQEEPETTVIFPTAEELHEMAIEESLQPVHPGIPGKVPFWNAYAQRFIYAPAFEFSEISDADSYRFSVKSDKSDSAFQFIAGQPWAPLTPVWKEIPVSMVHLKVEAMKNGDVIGLAGEKEFYKASPYMGPYAKPQISYRESVTKLLDYLFHASYIQHWLHEGVPDPGYGLYGYPSKMFSAVIHGMLLKAEFSEDDSEKEQALQIARTTADYLIHISEPEGRPLEFFPPTYTGPIYADMVDEYRGEDLSDRQMLIYPASAGQSYLDLYNVTGDENYLEAAIRIADTYKKLQLDNGSWYLLIYVENGEPVAGNFVVPTGVKAFLDRLKDEYAQSGYEDCSKRAMEYIMNNLVKDFAWEGQFEDQKPSEKYKNLSKGQACGYAMHLFNTAGDDPAKIAEAEELIRFAEDQFVVWGEPNPIDSWGIKSDKWLTPCVLEQYNFYTPVNASSANMIDVFKTAFDKTGNILYLSKAMDLANNIVVVQKDNGHYPTYLVEDLLDQEGWINCMVYTAIAVNDLDQYLKEISPDKEVTFP